jgi:hypothetical protein
VCRFEVGSKEGAEKCAILRFESKEGAEKCHFEV